MQGYPHFHRPIDDVIIGHDVSIGGDDHTAANAMLNLPLAAPHAWHTVAELLAGSGAEPWTEELGERIVSIAPAALLLSRRLLGPVRGDRNVDHCRCNPRRDCFGGLVESQKGIDAGVVDGRDWIIRSRCGIDVIVAEDERSSEQDESQSQQWRGEALCPCS